MIIIVAFIDAIAIIIVLIIISVDIIIVISMATIVKSSLACPLLLQMKLSNYKHAKNLSHC